VPLQDVHAEEEETMSTTTWREDHPSALDASPRPNNQSGRTRPCNSHEPKRPRRLGRMPKSSLVTGEVQSLPARKSVPVCQAQLRRVTSS